MTNRNDNIMTFIAGSSFPSVLVPFLTLGTAMLIHPDANFRPQLLYWGLPPIMGLWNIGLSKISKTMSRKAHLIAGVIIGLCFTGVGVRSGAPAELYNLSGNQAYMMIPIGVASHSFIWGVIVYWVNGCLLYTSPSPRDGLLSRMPSSA